MADRIAVLDGGRVQQVASPVELYRNPANLFVAAFIGTSNLVGGHLREGRFLSRLGSLPVSTTDGPRGEAFLVVRPEDVRLAGPGAGVLDGVVADALFQGGSTHLAVDVAGLDVPFLVSVHGIPEHRRGDEVSLRWDTAVVVEDVRR